LTCASRIRLFSDGGATSSRFPPTTKKSFDQISKGVCPRVQQVAPFRSSSAAFTRYSGVSTECAAGLTAILGSDRIRVRQVHPLRSVMSNPGRSDLDLEACYATPALFHATNMAKRARTRTLCSKRGHRPVGSPRCEGCKCIAVSAWHQRCSTVTDICDMGLSGCPKFAESSRATRRNDLTSTSPFDIDASDARFRVAFRYRLPERRDTWRARPLKLSGADSLRQSRSAGLEVGGGVRPLTRHQQMTSLMVYPDLRVMAHLW